MGLWRERCNASEITDRQLEAGRGAARAIVAQDATLTYDELCRQVARAGRMLRALGVRREERVLLVLDDTTVFPIVFLGAMRIGAVPVPVSPLDKDANFKHFVSDSYARLVVTDAELSERLARVLDDPGIRYLVRGGSGAGVIELDEAMSAQPDESADGAFESVRFCVSAAEALSAHTIERWRVRFGLEIVDGIGSTEVLDIYCSNRPGRIAPGTTGWPVPGYELRLVDDRDEVLDGPATGALHVRGDSCAAYYWHEHEKTKSSMLGEWFVSGDRYERGADGAYTYVGRVDDMLKVSGLWVSPIDMEHVLSEHPRVEGVGVVGVTTDGTTRIAAYVQCTEGGGDDALAEELRGWCRERMRRYEYPHVVRFVDELPRTLTGKVQRFRLREWAQQASRVEPELAAVQPDPGLSAGS